MDSFFSSTETCRRIRYHLRLKEAVRSIYDCANDFKFPKRSLKIYPSQKFQINSKNGRTVYVFSVVAEAATRIGVSDDNQFIFINKYGKKPIDQSYVNVKLKELLRKYDIVMEGNASSHLFRKTLGNRVLRLNNYSAESVILLMELFSHSSPAMTKRYLGIREKQIMDVYDSVRL